MGRYNIQRCNPARFAAACERQNELRSRYAGVITREMLCDYCGHTVGIYMKGSHAPVCLKCQKCGQITIFEPLSFRLVI